ncbi:hypothetical protein [Novosphingobium beihaiensis]|uniref:Sulfotransferase family protein n=1 Tax=Novosphingobium beihaiensis TaxID=2930389 RepID=A0ABT0BPS2_9SPHN|nr:hypothetical protein [Novosphingobium beihaiensis]MCJ2187060.1 hypothetical protein [Novosphingobium beihaiensis]
MTLSLILFQPRSGSSLLAQTLRLLGKPVLGGFNSNCRQALNPLGFWDIPEIRDHGLTFERREKYREELADAVVKVLWFSTFEGGGEQWAWFSEVRPAIFITYRHPLEQALSANAAFSREQAGTQEHFLAITHSLRNWTFGLGKVVRFVRENHPELIQRIRFVGYHEHLEDPVAFVDKVARHAGLTPDAACLRRAMENIDKTLYRFRINEVPAEYLRWYQPMPARRYFEILRTAPASLWEEQWPDEPTLDVLSRANRMF